MAQQPNEGALDTAVGAASSTEDSAQETRSSKRDDVNRGRRGRSLLERAIPRWGVVAGVLAVLMAIYLQHPYYRGGTFATWRTVFPLLAMGWGLLGLPYVMATLRRYKGDRLYFTDTGLLWLVIFRVAAGTRHFHVWRIRRLKNTILSLVVKAFFGPLMVGFTYGHVSGATNRWLALKGLGRLPNFPGKLSFDLLGDYFSKAIDLVRQAPPVLADFTVLFESATYTMKNVRWGLDMAYDWIFIVDCGIALVGYLFESRWLGNKTKSVEPTGFGWAIALACYPPFNSVLGTYAPFADVKVDHFGEVTNLWIKGAVVFLFAIYASATVAFGPRFSNLTNRGIITRGPYALVRHPAYLCKCTAWWLEHANRMSVQTAFALVGLCCVYGLRAWTEERHLSQDPDYLAYKKKVPWILFPGIY